VLETFSAEIVEMCNPRTPYVHAVNVFWKLEMNVPHLNPSLDWKKSEQLDPAPVRIDYHRINQQSGLLDNSKGFSVDLAVDEEDIGCCGCGYGGLSPASANFSQSSILWPINVDLALDK